MGSKLVAISLAAVLALACSRSYLQRGSDLYSNHRYIEAAEVFERTEERLSDYSETERAHYGLYRGLTLLALGDRNGAHRWFAYSSHVEQQHPGALNKSQRNALERGWHELGRQLRQAPAPEPPDRTVAAGAGEADDPLPEKRSLH